MGQRGHMKSQSLKTLPEKLSPFLSSILSSQRLKRTGSRFLAQTPACCIHFLHQMDTTINLFLHHFLQACTKHATQVSPCKATSCCVCFCCCWQTCLCVLTAGLPSQRVNFKQTKAAFWFGRDFPISLCQSFLLKGKAGFCFVLFSVFFSFNVIPAILFSLKYWLAALQIACMQSGACQHFLTQLAVKVVDSTTIGARKAVDQKYS